MRPRASALAGLLLSIFPAVALVASTHVWSGFGVNPNWNNGFNWSSDPNTPASPPYNDPNGVFLQFPAAGVLQHTMNQNITGLTVNSMTFSGSPYVLNGASLSVGGRIAVVNDPNSVPDPNSFHTIDLPLSLVSGFTSDVSQGASSLRLQGPVSGPGGVTIVGAGTTILAGDNSYAGPTLVNAGNLVVTSPNALGNGLADTQVAPNARLTLSNYNQTIDPNSIDPNAVETIFQSGGSRLSAVGTNTVFSVITSGAPVLFDLAPGSILSLASLGGSGQVFVDSGGTLRVTGPSPATSFVGVGVASLIVNGSLVSTSQIQLLFPGSLLGGTGVVGSVQVLAGAVSPGESAGRLTVSGNLSYVGSPATFRVELAGLTAGTGYDQLNATGTVSLGPATSLVATRSFLPAIGSTFTVISAPGGLTGQFVGLPDLALFTINGQTYQIDYTATSVILTAMDTMPVTLQHFTLE